MCNANPYKAGFVGKVNSKIDPLGAYIGTGNKGKLDPLNLNNAPDIPAPPPPPQEPKAADNPRRSKRNYAGMGTTMLTGPGGVTNGALNTGSTTLLGG